MYIYIYIYIHMIYTLIHTYTTQTLYAGSIGARANGLGVQDLRQWLQKICDALPLYHVRRPSPRLRVV